MNYLEEQLRPQISSDPAAFPFAERRIDAYDGACRELFVIRNPSWYKKNGPEFDAARAEFFRTTQIPDVWVYYPQEKTLVHTVDED
ncbi:MAG: hypothetical protein AAB932_03245, partial [Patescibacteria group bacterium]